MPKLPVTQKMDGQPQPIGELTETNIEQIEREAIEKVNRTITILEGALATWDAAREKPVDLRDRFARYTQFHDALASWESKALKARGKREEPGTRVQRLREFVDICYAYA